jgi:hypothetical protein
MATEHPESIYAKLATGNAGRIGGSADSLGRAIQNLDTAGTDAGAGRRAVGAWSGDGSTAFADRMAKTDAAIGAARDRLDIARQVIDSAAKAYGTMRASADELIRFYRQCRLLFAGGDMPMFDQYVGRQLAMLRDGYDQVLRANMARLSQVKPAFEEVAGTTEGWRRTRLRAVPAVPPPSADPKDVARWWKSLSDTQRARLPTTDYDRLGRLRGLPPEVLDIANRRRIEVDQQTYGAQADDLGAQVKARAAQLGVDPDDENAMRGKNDPQLSALLNEKATAARRRNNADSAGKNLTKANEHAQAIGLQSDDVFVLSYSPDGPGRKEGTLAVAFGNPGTAKNVAITVPGTANTIGSDFTGQASALKGEMDAAHPGEPNATIAWLGYDAPDWDNSVASDVGAKDGARGLVDDVNGYRAAAGAAGTPHQHVTAIGHSYGAVTVGYAGMHGLAADDIAFVGSPGAGASSADQLSAGPGHVWAGGNEHDPVIQGTNGTYFTEDGSDTGPYDPKFGAHSFDTDDGKPVLRAHSAYYEGSSLTNLGNIATGDYPDVTQPDPWEAPIAPGTYATDNGFGDLGVQVAYGGAEVFHDFTHRDFSEAGRDLADLGVSAVGTVAEGARGAVKGVANVLGRLF